jgi:hypothetical protein
LGTGIGGALILDGKPWRGHTHTAAELGHIITHADGLPCSCSRRGCFEMYASASALSRMGNGQSAKEIIDAAARQEAEPSRIFQSYLHELGIGLVTLIVVFNPEVIVLGGGISAAGDILLQGCRTEIRRQFYGRPAISWAISAWHGTAMTPASSARRLSPPSELPPGAAGVRFCYNRGNPPSVSGLGPVRPVLTTDEDLIMKKRLTARLRSLIWPIMAFLICFLLPPIPIAAREEPVAIQRTISQPTADGGAIRVTETIRYQVCAETRDLTFMIPYGQDQKITVERIAVADTITRIDQRFLSKPSWLNPARVRPRP